MAIFNSSANTGINLNQLGLTIERQLKHSYQMTYTKMSYQKAFVKSGLDNFPTRTFARPASKNVSVKVSVYFRIIIRKNACFTNELLVDIKDDKGRMHQLYGNAIHSGSLLNLNEVYVNDMIKGLDNNTLPHEFGHSLGLDHVNDKETYTDDSRQYMTAKQQQTKDSLNAMFSGDSRYMHNSTSTVITPRQMDIIIENYRMNHLNR